MIALSQTEGTAEMEFIARTPRQMTLRRHTCNPSTHSSLSIDILWGAHTTVMHAPRIVDDERTGSLAERSRGVGPWYSHEVSSRNDTPTAPSRGGRATSGEKSLPGGDYRTNGPPGNHYHDNRKLLTNKHLHANDQGPRGAPTVATSLLC